MTRQSRQCAMLACVNLNSTAVSVLYFAAILAGSFKCLVGLALEILVLFPARTALHATSVLIRKHLFTHSLCPSFRPPMYVPLVSATRLQANSCSMALLTAAPRGWNTSQKWTSWRNNPPAYPSGRGPFIYVYIQKRFFLPWLLGVVNISKWQCRNWSFCPALWGKIWQQLGDSLSRPGSALSRSAHPSLAGAPTYCWPSSELNQGYNPAESYLFCCLVWF